MTTEPCTKIVIDAANLIHDDRGIEKYDSEGEQITQMIPERLVSAVEQCQIKGYTVTALLKKLTYKWGLREYKSNNPEYANFAKIVELKERGTLKLIDSKEDDLYIVEYALSENALILTRDWFNDHREQRKDIKWDAVDVIRKNRYEFIENKFTCPDIRDISTTDNASQISDPLAEIKQLVELQFVQIQNLNQRVHELEERNFTKEIDSMSEQEVERVEKHVKKDSGRSKSADKSANEYVKRSQQNGFKKLRKKAALLKDIERRGLSSNQGPGAVMDSLQQKKIIRIQKDKVTWR
jgi:hypothetical protein